MNQDLAIFIVPFALILACGLLAAGGLYFIDIRYLKDARYAFASVAAGAVILIVLEIVLYGSSVGFLKEQQLKTSLCELDAESAHPEARQGADAAVLHDAIVGCMKEAGYEWDANHRHCQDARIATNPFFYLPIATFDRAITGLQMKFE
ncbi:MAG: hypothetical protein FJX45_08895 [Alphaproteobacteria bacterium]|nr:hypothetical protein [Alphaproteobacteria bacterium]MBM3652502.1 hypothetical protein [Alphaproteobacteria bacterium]